MADKAAASEEVDEAGGKKATLDASTTISESTDYGDEPPRILMGLNDAPVQFPEGTLWKGDEAVRHEAASAGAAEIKEILTTVRKRLDVSYDAMWKTQEKQISLWSTDPEEERWAQRFSERYALITYGGPGQSYFNDGGWDPFIFSRAQARSRKVTLYEYDSADNKGKYTIVRKGTTQVAGWKDPENIVATQGRPPETSQLPPLGLNLITKRVANYAIIDNVLDDVHDVLQNGAASVVVIRAEVDTISIDEVRSDLAHRAENTIARNSAAPNGEGAVVPNGA